MKYLPSQNEKARALFFHLVFGIPFWLIYSCLHPYGAKQRPVVCFQSSLTWVFHLCIWQYIRKCLVSLNSCFLRPSCQLDLFKCYQMHTCRIYCTEKNAMIPRHLPWPEKHYSPAPLFVMIACMHNKGPVRALNVLVSTFFEMAKDPTVVSQDPTVLHPLEWQWHQTVWRGQKTMWHIVKGLHLMIQFLKQPKVCICCYLTLSSRYFCLSRSKCCVDTWMFHHWWILSHWLKSSVCQ